MYEESRQEGKGGRGERGQKQQNKPRKSLGGAIVLEK